MVKQRTPEEDAAWRKHMSDAQKRRFSDPEQRRLTGEATRRRASTPEARAANSARAKIAQNNPKTRAKHRASMARLYAETDLRERISAATKEAMQRPEVEERRREGRRRSKEREQSLMSSQEYREKMRDSVKAAFRKPGRAEAHQATMKLVAGRPENRERVRRMAQDMWNDPIKRAHMLERLRSPEVREKWAQSILETLCNSGPKFANTSIELVTAAVLDSLGIEYVSQKPIAGYLTDFYVPSRKLVIECDGEYWHSLPAVAARDQAKNTRLTQRGYTVLRLSEKDIKAANFEALYAALDIPNR